MASGEKNDFIKIFGVIASIAVIIGTCITAIQLIPAFGQWLSPRAPNEPTPTIQEFSAIPTVQVTQIIPVTQEKPTPTFAPVPTLTPTPILPISLGLLKVPGSLEEGVKFVANQQGRYTFEYMPSAYSPWPEAQPSELKWRTQINIYKNRPISWEKRPYNPEDDESIAYIEPRSPDAMLFGVYYPMTTQTEAIGVAQAQESIQFDLNSGDYLIFVALDDQNWYNNPGSNVGEVIFEVLFTGN